MRSRLISPLLLLVVSVLFTSASSSQASVQNRIAAVTDSSRVPLQGSVSGRVRRAADLGAAPQGRTLDSLSLRFSLTSAQQADLTQLLADQLNPGSPSYHQWLTPEQYGARFGLSSADIAKVSTWLTGQGFKVTGTARSSTFIEFTGTVAQVQQAFGTSIHSMSLDGEQHIANLTDPVLPASIAGVVSAVTGLNDFKMKPRTRIRTVPVDPARPLYTQTTNNVTSHYITPADFYTIYDVNPLLTSSPAINGSGFTIAVVGETDLFAYSTAPAQGVATPVADPDIAAFRKAAGLPASTIRVQLYGVDPGVQAATGDLDESHIDIEWAGAIAPSANVLFVYGSDVFVNGLTNAVDGKLAPIITSSYGLCESSSSPSTLSIYNQLFQQANAQGQTIVNSAGDAGATDCDTAGVASEGLAVDFPASSPFVTGAGGTMFSADVNTPASYWNTSNSTSGGSATQYIPELPWNETTAAAGLGNLNTPGGGGAGGGGASSFFAKPAWQTGTGAGNTPNDGSRDVPDISLNAAANHDGYVVCSQGSCTNGFLSSTNTLNVYGGTSLVAPSFAGILALVEQKLGGAPNAGLGNVNPVLYGLANGPTYTSIFHDITSGNNSVPCVQGTPNCPNGGSIGYTAGTGYDQASGLGTLDVLHLVNGWSTAIPAGTGSALGAGLTTTTLTTTGSRCGATTGTLALTVAVAAYAASSTPTGTVQFLVDNAAVGAPQPLAGGAVAYTLNTTGLSSGGHTISAVYSGDSAFAGSKGTLLASDGTLASVDVVSTTKPDFSLSPCTGAVSVLPGAVAPSFTFTLTPFQGFTGTVALTAVNNSSAHATTAFTLSPVTLNSASGATTAFVLTASASSTSSAATAQLKPGPRHPGSGPEPRYGPRYPTWYATGSGAALACIFVLIAPRRRRWGTLLAAILSVGALTAIGCSNTSTTGATTTTPSSQLTPTPAGTYTFTITAVSGSLVHSAQVKVTVQ